MSSAKEVPLVSGTSDLEQGRKKVKVAKNLFLCGAGCHGACSALLRLEEEGSVPTLRADNPCREGKGTKLPALRSC